jgi:hypothetical protein
MKNIFLIILVFALAFVSCDQENMGTIYEPETSYVAFSSSIVPENILSAENNFSVSVQLVRSDLTAATTASVQLEMNENIDGVFELESNSVTFENGKGEAYVKIIPLVDASLIDPTKTYTFNLTLTGDNVSEFYGETTYKASFKYTPVGEGTFNSVFFGEVWSVDIEKLEVGNITLYKARGLYESGYDITIVVEGNSVTIAEQPAWFYDSDLGDVMIVGSGTLDGKVLTISIEHYIPDVGGWDPETEILTLP